MRVDKYSVNRQESISREWGMFLSVDFFFSFLTHFNFPAFYYCFLVNKRKKKEDCNCEH